MKKQKFGQTGLEVASLGFGCMRLPLDKPNDLTSINYSLSRQMLHKAIDNGVNYVDTAYPYHSKARHLPGESELFLAEALKGGYREQVHLATKLPTWLVESRRDMDKFLDEQLKRLNSPYVDFYLAHNLNYACWGKMKNLGVIGFMNEAIKDGRIKYAGFSFHDRYELFEEIMLSYDWALAQIQHNYLDIDYQAGERGLKLAVGRGAAVLIMEPLRGGFLINHMPQELCEYLHAIEPTWSLARWGLAWLWSKPESLVVLSGMSAMEHVVDNLDSAENHEDLSPRHLAALDKVRAFFKANIKVDCTSCGYCLPCPSGVSISKNFEFYNDYYLVDSDEVRTRTKYYYSAQMAQDEWATHCTGCGQCQERCPQHIPISTVMPEIAKIFSS
ncbi:MAG: aldo/keto reductase [Candidatus Adiutrix sp.]